ncbi:MAG: hypothetical protein KTR25_15480 [Myxococcales bacterium]|nr:hypothetical protein [Myxococcales bacterium]
MPAGLDQQAVEFTQSYFCCIVNSPDKSQLRLILKARPNGRSRFELLLVNIS